MVANPSRRWFQFSLMSLLVLILICSVGFAWMGRERRHEQATEYLRQLGGQTSYGDKARIVYLWRNEHCFGMDLKYVTDLDAAIRSMRQLKSFTHIVLLKNQGNWETVLRREFPHTKIELGHAGVI